MKHNLHFTKLRNFKDISDMIVTNASYHRELWEENNELGRESISLREENDSLKRSCSQNISTIFRLENEVKRLEEKLTNEIKQVHSEMDKWRTMYLNSKEQLEKLNKGGE